MVMKNKILVDPSLVIITIYYMYVCSMPGSKEEDFKRNYAISLYDLYGHTRPLEPLSRGS